MPKSREWHLVARPQGWPAPDDFALVAVDAPEPGPGQLLVRNLYVSVDPYMRGRMNDVMSYSPPFGLNEPMLGGAIGRVVAVGPAVPGEGAGADAGEEAAEGSANGIGVGDHVLHGLGWREYAVLDAARGVKVDPAAAPLPMYLGPLGMTGLTAYAGLLRVAGFTAGETVFVSGAAGAVGSQVGQIAKLKGAARVIGSAGSDEKVALLTREYGFDVAFNYKKAPVAEQLRAAAPDGIDVYFDNVGGEHLEAAIASMRPHGRAALCGAIAGYNATEPDPGPRNLAQIVSKRLTLSGFLVGEQQDLRPEFVREVTGWLGEGRLRHHETVVSGIENTLDAFLGMLRGANTGKMLVALPE
ncbi:NADP-dependent oxidoreductase [Streptomyces sp. NBC_01190]|uniref:NADP-dependent oxidoreductase n=1 Tax=Streptomyces sp. NBC_01190 TaxID=2903767 RepID=UPI00386B8BA2|nr:NADP-dependent oxidoreductase [Streptomyces sp. NBC_01190]